MATTPMMEQYLQIKEEYQDAFLFFRLGDFYELFHDDALLAAKELEITLTGRGKGEEKIPMCGVPHHSSKQYIATLIDKGYKVAICEQTEDPSQAKGVVKRDVVQVITPGTVMETNDLGAKENNYIAAICEDGSAHFAMAAADTTTGEMFVTKLESYPALVSEASAYRPKEIVVSDSLSKAMQAQLETDLAVTLSYADAAEDGRKENLSDPALQNAFGILIGYLNYTMKRSLDHLQEPTFYLPQEFMTIDQHSKRNLELSETLRDKTKKGSLLGVLDRTSTAMGGRLLKHWLEKPLVKETSINERHSLVAALIDQFFTRETLKEQLRGVYDLERLAGRVAFGNVNGRDLLQLKQSLGCIPEMLETVRSLNHPGADQMIAHADEARPLKELLEEAIHENCPVSITEGNVIKDGYSEQLDIYRDAMTNGRTWIASLERQEREITGIKSLKVGFNKVFGYYIEVTRANLPYLPEGRYERKQTLANAERYITEELKEKERTILEAEEKSEKLEHELFLDIRERVKAYIQPLQDLARIISTFDVLTSFADVSEDRRFVRPSFNQAGRLDVSSARHPVVETMIDQGKYVPNDICMNGSREMLLITGPNMSGKSTYMRQLALIAIMAQAGCCVPADKADLPIFDQIFTRIGAADDLSQGQSTFMVEMIETQHAVNNATENSLILLDEIGRGTSTYDGMSLAQSIIEYIHSHVRAKTLFSTHYHELTHLAGKLDRLENVHVRAKEEDGNVVFLHQVMDGPADRSYGIYVAQLADLPDEIISRAKHILAEFENGAGAEGTEEQTNEQKADQIPLFQIEQGNSEEELPAHLEEIKAEIARFNLLQTTPLEAMQLLERLQQKLTDS
ncbi:DNA mismatch repair protein MutS [Salisediminibacterium halotolerans]|uniref:DNA mismatch repair protein MutS n=1 Tax=Salisediminibacterium halotolerans TaxID=517425 RepID=UPI000EB1EAE3|nr:DNA mismatch repair protein MutS [Salisediminibacterium halotolerans]RLJ74144.1 DNA mismatch repair protein MutS [Actinophytocola xinjiangensis]RPE87763.1 DNA mismatch repair protein MutS [Salisediminibacterium halotolerans]TWG34981.1 DNA mismatch repair protein MutS [Salisediminibacterium halotolerans]GEL07682.1 DNA mismatch repair protein MutS [Salisediminibacterium halotolerans]